MQISNQDQPKLKAELRNNVESNQEQLSTKEGIERISNVLWEVINSQIQENDISLWKMWR